MSDEHASRQPRDGGDDTTGAGGDETEDGAETAIDFAEEALLDTWHLLVDADGYLPVLLLLFAALVAAPLIGDSKPGAFLSIVVISAAVLLTVYRSTRRSRLRRLALVLSIAATALTTLAVLGSEVLDAEGRQAAIVVSAISLMLLLGVFPLVLVRSFKHRRVSLNTVCATLSAYLIIGLTFASLYRLMHLIGPAFFAQATHPTPGQFTYFSVITLTTLGFGDLSPATDPGRAFVMVEALVGQVFLVTTLARVVSLLGEERRTSRPDDPRS